ncbi:MAG: hypothetical protein HC828_16430 [Blastochloris sp.]|nr:hypothetical protein [Blastochloris sp.]
MRIITISDETYAVLEQQARTTGRHIDDILDDIVHQTFGGESCTPATPPKPQPNSDHANEQVFLQRNLATFNRLLPELLNDHADEYVALRHGEVVGFSHDKRALWREVYDTHGRGGILIMQVTTSPAVKHFSARTTLLRTR